MIWAVIAGVLLFTTFFLKRPHPNILGNNESFWLYKIQWATPEKPFGAVSCLPVNIGHSKWDVDYSPIVSQQGVGMRTKFRLLNNGSEKNVGTISCIWKTADYAECLIEYNVSIPARIELMTSAKCEIEIIDEEGARKQLVDLLLVSQGKISIINRGSQ